MKVKSNLSYTLAAIGAFGFLPLAALASVQDYTQKYQSEINLIGRNPRFCDECKTKWNALCGDKFGFIKCLGVCKDLPFPTLSSCVKVFEANRKDSSAEDEQLRKEIAKLKKQLESVNANASPSASGSGNISTSGSGNISNSNLTEAQRYIEQQIAAGTLTTLDLMPLEKLKQQYATLEEQYREALNKNEANNATYTLSNQLEKLNDAIAKQEAQLKIIAKKKRTEAEQEAKQKANREKLDKQLTEDKLEYDALVQSFGLLTNNGKPLLEIIGKSQASADIFISGTMGNYSEQQKKALRYFAQITIDQITIDNDQKLTSIQNRLKSLVAAINNSLGVKNAPSTTPKEVQLTPEETADKAAYEAIKDKLNEGKIKSLLANHGVSYTKMLSNSSGFYTTYMSTLTFEKEVSAAVADSDSAATTNTIKAFRYLTSLFLKQERADQQMKQAQTIKQMLETLLKRVEGGYQLKTFLKSAQASTQPPSKQISSNAVNSERAAPSKTQAQSQLQQTSNSAMAPSSSSEKTASKTAKNTATNADITTLVKIQEKGFTPLKANKILQLMKKQNLSMDEAITKFQQN